MLSNLNLKIKNIGPINEVDMDIGKINVIGGLNATGKSTVSKLLYCILKGNISNRQEFAYSLINPALKSILRRYRNQIVHGGMENSSSDDKLINYFDLNRSFRSLSNYELLEIYERIKNDILINDIKLKNSSWKEEYMVNRTKKIDRQIEVIEKNDNELYLSILKRILSSEFYSLKFSGILNFKGLYNKQAFDYFIDLRNSLVRNSSLEGFFSLSDVNYIDSISILDIEYLNLGDFRRNEHTHHILSNLEDDSESFEFLDEEFNEKIIDVRYKINELINGKFESTKEGFSFVSNEGHETLIGDTSSGIKQIGIIDILLDHRKIKEESFLIIDEPEVNLHPEWQIKFAEVLCILANDLNVHIYINSHSPMFIEAMTLYSEYYGLLDDTKVYLTEKHDFGGFTFKQIHPKDMGAVYENLTSPYDELDDIKSKMLLDIR